MKKKYAIGHKIGFGTYSIVRECKIRKEWIDENEQTSQTKAGKYCAVIDKSENDCKSNCSKDNNNSTRVFAIKIINKDTLDHADLSMLESEVSFLRTVVFFFFFSFLPTARKETAIGVRCFCCCCCCCCCCGCIE